MKPDPAFLNENPLDYLENQKKLNPFLIKKEEDPANNLKNSEEKAEKSKKAANIENFHENNEENHKIESTSYETFLNNEINKLKSEFQVLKDDQEIILKASPFDHSNMQTNQRIPKDFFQNSEVFTKYLKSKENETIPSEFKDKFLRILISMSKNEEENQNLIKNLFVVVPREGKLLVFAEEKTVVIETKSNDIEGKFQGVFNDLLRIS